MSLLALLKARSHSQDVARWADTSKAQRWNVEKPSSISHQAIGSNFSVTGIAEPAVKYLRNPSVMVFSPFLQHSYSLKASLFFILLCGARCA